MSRLKQNEAAVVEQIVRLRDVIGQERCECLACIRELLAERNRLLGVRECTLEVAS